MPERIDHYVIIREIGRGGMGIVYEALDTRLNQRVAIKVLLEDIAHAQWR
jgi:serine/threonine protein kinase